MGEVYRARDPRLGRNVAIKVSHEQFSDRFQREARAVAALNHPNICTLYDVGPNYLVMEYIEGTPLKGPFSTEKAREIALQIASALVEAHRKGVIHRDLKPANILLTGTGVKLLDFGLAKSEQPAGGDESTGWRTEAGAVLGTAGYMSPEQASGKPGDARSDIFSFGSVLYEMLSGQRAFQGATAVAAVAAVLHKDPPSLHAPPEFVRIVARCLRKTPTERFQSAADLQAALAGETALSAAQPSIAVLPFANMSRDADDEYFSDGLAEEIINALAQMPGLKVIARTSAFAFKGKNEDIRRIADALGVTTVLEGSVRRAGSRIRVTAQLIEARNGTHLWSQRYDRELADVFAVQDEISAAIAGALKVKLAPVPERKMPSLPAYEAYLRYRSYQWKFTPEASRRSRECLEKALALDPDFALPYVGLADYHFALASVGAIRSADAMPRARELARRALEIDPALPEAHAMLGIVAGHYDYDWDEAERRFRLATAREPLSPHLRTWYAVLWLLPTGRAEEASQQLARAIDEDPLSAVQYHVRSLVLQNLGLDEEALASHRKAVEVDPQFWVGWLQLGLHYAIRGRHAEALPCAERAYHMAAELTYTIGVMAGALLNAGQPGHADKLLARLHRDSYAGPVGLFHYYLACRDFERAAEWADKAAGERFPGFIAHFRAYEPLLRDRRAWPALMKKVHLA
jgi:serine/threonine-protein kinase